MKTITFFSRREFLGIAVIFLSLVILTLVNFRISLRKARDIDRITQLSMVRLGLINYQRTFGRFPASTADGRIIACLGPETKKLPTAGGPVFVNLAPCEWGKDAVTDPTDVSYPPFITTLPNDPQSARGVRYIYVGEENKFSLYGSLEGKVSGEPVSSVAQKKIPCGSRVCNFEKSS